MIRGESLELAIDRFHTGEALYNARVDAEQPRDRTALRLVEDRGMWFAPVTVEDVESVDEAGRVEHGSRGESEARTVLAQPGLAGTTEIDGRRESRAADENSMQRIRRFNSEVV